VEKKGRRGFKEKLEGKSNRGLRDRTRLRNLTTPVRKGHSGKKNTRKKGNGTGWCSNNRGIVWTPRERPKKKTQKKKRGGKGGSGVNDIFDRNHWAPTKRQAKGGKDPYCQRIGGKKEKGGKTERKKGKKNSA